MKTTWVAKRLLAWFDGHARDLPWRRTTDAYSIWVSEVMLQQTQVATVVPYFERFLHAFPNVKALAKAPLHEVLRHWEGLGYYRRARDLHGSAQVMAKEHGGRVPSDAVTLRRLPGFGRYTTGAVLSQAYGKPMPILEANSRRVLCRFFGLRGDPFRKPLEAELWRRAEAILPPEAPGRFNQALMELGALVCSPESPNCAGCPLASECVAHKEKLQGRIPMRRKPPAVVRVEEVAVVVRKKNRVLLAQRPESGLWAGLWEFPHAVRDAGEDVPRTAERTIRDLAGLRAEIGTELMTVKHAVTRFRITLVCVEAEHQAGRFRSKFYKRSRWLLPEQLGEYPVSSPQRRLAEFLRVAPLC